MANGAAPIDQYRLAILADEIAFHTFNALRSYDAARALVEDPARRQSREVWFHIQMFLNEAAIASKFLFPPSRAAAAISRARQLRTTLNVADVSPLAAREARNYLEHIDERLDLWVTPANPPGLLDIVYSDHNELNYFRRDENFWRHVLILETMEFGFQDSTGQRLFALIPLKDSLEALLPLATNLFLTTFALEDLGGN